MNHGDYYGDDYGVGAAEAQAAVTDVNKALNACPWRWQTDGALIQLRWNGRMFWVFVPLEHIEAGVNNELVSVGCPCLEPRVGGDSYAVGFFGSLYRAAKKAVSRVATTVIAPHKYIYKRIVPKSIQRTANVIVRQAQGVVRQAGRYATDPKVLRVAALVSTIIPGAGPAVAAGLLTAAQIAQAARTVQRASALAQQAINQGVRSPAAFAAANKGNAANALLAMLR